MALIKDSLKSQLTLIQENQPDTLALASLRWATAFFSYFSAGMAGPLTSLPSLTVSTLQGYFLTSMQDNKFVDKLGGDLNKWIAAVSWVGPGFTPGTSIIPGPLASAPLGEAILKGALAPDTIATAVDTWAKTITVTAVTTAVPPVTTILTVS